ncbi:hypothetical protein MHB48_13345 [Psychrobacillus sp. FSL H8-0483]|uniref:hypothetical protein n=1 Tax=Psychrobacillus sp. FSL H8-0483 TaxID=2921389 RepID=UPI003159BA12
MEVKNWEVKEQFRFPQSFGIPKEIKTVKVTPQYEQSEVEDAIQIGGIYHITCYVRFEEGEHAHHGTGDFTQIEDLDVQGEFGYFEYAVPMSVDISKQKIQAGSTPSLSVQNVNSKTTGHEGIEISWIVNCEYETSKEQIVKADVQEAVAQEEQVAQVAQKETKELNAQVQEESENLEESELQFILNLDDGYSKLTFPSNYVFVKQKAEEE